MFQKGTWIFHGATLCSIDKLGSLFCPHNESKNKLLIFVNFTGFNQVQVSPSGHLRQMEGQAGNSDPIYNVCDSKTEKSAP